MDPHKSHDTSSSGSKDAKRQQFTNKQRMDMYAFCVLELEMHSNKVSIKKQQQAIQKVLYEHQKETHKPQQQNVNQNQQPDLSLQQQQQQQSLMITTSEQQPTTILTPSSTSTPVTTITSTTTTTPPQQINQPPPQQNGEAPQQNDSNCNLSGSEGKTLLQLQQEVAMTRKCYSDYQKTQVLTSSMLRDVQKRFSKYYPDAAIPSRSTIKHVFEKCVTHGTVENIRTPRKATKIPQGDEIEHLLIHEPQLSLRQLAQKLNVSTGTVSRRCKALGLVPESVTIKHQQLATARRQKQIKQLENQSKAPATATVSNGNHDAARLDASTFDD